MAEVGSTANYEYKNPLLPIDFLSKVLISVHFMLNSRVLN